MPKIVPILKSVRRISPSRYTAMTKCPYRVVLANSCSGPLLPYPPASHLGNIVHESIRLILTRKIRSISDFEENWDRLLVKEEQSLQAMGFGFFTPLSENVHGYTIKKLQVKCMIKNESNIEINEDQRKITGILTEKWLESRDSLIGGFSDIIIDMNGYTKLSDFKSGKILLAEGDVKEEYEDQLKLYAYLHNEVFGKYPDELSIIDIENKEYTISFTQTECEILAEKSREMLLEINNQIKNDERKLLAKPDLANCKNCLYRPACDFYWNLPLSEDDSIFRDIRGRVSTVKQFRNGNLNVTLNKDYKELMISHTDKEYLHFLTDLIGKEVAFYNVRQGGMPETYQALKTTKIYEV